MPNHLPEATYALVTGGAHRVGRILAMELAHLGYNLIIHYHTSVDAARSIVQDIQNLGRDVICIQADLRQPQEIGSLFEQIVRMELPLQILINSAAVMPTGRLMDATPSEWMDVVDTNLRAPCLCAREAARIMVQGGLVLNICDEFAHQTWKTHPLYGLTKASLEQMTRILAEELSPCIRVNGLALGPVLPPAGMPEWRWNRIVERSALKTAFSPARIGQALAYLIKKEYISGETIYPYEILSKNLDQTGNSQ